MIHDEVEVAHDSSSQVLKLIDFLSEYDAQRHPPVHDIGDEGFYRLDERRLPQAPDVRLTPGAEYWLSVEFVTLPAVPEPQGAAAEGIIGEIGHTQPPDLVSLPEESAMAESEETADLVAARDAAQRWIDGVWEPWSAAYRQAQEIKALYRDLFEQASRLASDRDSVELVWGFAMLGWDVSDGTRISHPLLAIPVEISIDEQNQTLRVRPEGALELQMQCLADVDIRDRQGLTAFREALDADPADSWSGSMRDTLRRIVRMLDDGGAVRGEGAHPIGAPVVDETWVLYMRRRRPDYQGFLSELRDLYRSGATVPPAFSAMVLDKPPTVFDASSLPTQLTTDMSESALDFESEPLLLPLPANEEQIRILELAQQRPGVTVQGPPGTGKTHTIANLISHYVAYGKRVLVVAEKEQALARVTEKVPEQIRDLAVSVLGGDDEGRRQLGAAISRIQDRVSSADRNAADAEITRLTHELDAIDRGIAQATDQLLSTRLREVQTLPGVWLAGIDPVAEAVARWLAANEEDLSYIPDTVAPTVASPIEPAELAEMCRLIDSVGVSRAGDAAYILPELDRLPKAEQLAQVLMRCNDLRTELLDATPEVGDWSRVDEVPITQRWALVHEVQDEFKRLEAAEVGWLSRVVVQLEDPLLRGEWQQLVDDLGRQREQIISVRGALSAHEIDLPIPAPPELSQQLNEAHSLLTSKGGLGLVHRSLKRALGSCKVDGHEPRTPDDVMLCRQLLLVVDHRSKLRLRWNNQIAPVGGPECVGTQPEVELREPLEEIVGLLGARKRWVDLVNRLEVVGIHASPQPSASAATRLALVCQLVVLRSEERSAQAECDSLLAYLEGCSAVEDASPLTAALASAVREGATERYAKLRQQIDELSGITIEARRLLQLRAAMARKVPLWTEQILRDPVAARDPGRLSDAWQWRQAETWLAEQLAGPKVGELQAQLEHLIEQRRRTVADLVGQRAWRRLVDNLGDKERRALNSYLVAVNRYGKTGGKYAARWLGEMRRALDESKTAIPVWVMTTARAMTNFHPEEQPPFDVLIIDEASQAGFEALPLLSLAEKTIIVGDDKQTSPENVGLDQQQVFGLMEDHLSSIPGFRILFNPSNSLYDMAKLQFPDSVMLVEHFRCLPEIISFSNRFYDNRIEPLRDQAPHPHWRSLGAVKVLDGYRSGTVNQPEANAVVDLVAELVNDPAYEGMTFGVITLLAGGQARMIDDMLLDRLGPQIFRECKVRVGEPAAFQGDERDVVVVSSVVGTDPNNPGKRISSMTGLGAERRINVAASRALQQMWIVYSVDPEHLANGDLRAELIRHCRDPRGLELARDNAIDRCESDFEKAVLARILDRGYRRIRAQYEVGSQARNYRIDLVVEGAERRLAIECDGERWHGPDRWHADHARQQVLERAGWTFERIRGSAFYRNPETALHPLWQRLDDLGIPTGDEWLRDDGIPPATREVYGSGSNTDHGASPSNGDNDAPKMMTVVKRQGDAGSVSVAPAEPLVHKRDSATVLLQPRAGIDGPVTAAGQPTTAPVGNTNLLMPYVEWFARPLPEIGHARLLQVGATLGEIVAAEGPMHALRAYQLYVKASGGHRVGPQLRSQFNHVLHLAIANGAVSMIKDDIEDYVDRTLYAPGGSPVVVRELGPRQLTDVPRSELRAFIELLGIADFAEDERTREVLDSYGLIRLTDRAREYVTECVTYTWNEQN